MIFELSTLKMDNVEFQNNSLQNETSFDEIEGDFVSTCIDNAVMTMVAINMIGVGGHIDGEKMVLLIKQPLLVSIAMVIRFALMPAFGLGLVEMFDMTEEEEISIMSIILAPHEGIGCLFLILFDGDLTEAVAIETINNFTSTALLPLWAIFFETRIYGSPGHILLPTKPTFIFLGIMSTAAMLGFILRHRCETFYDCFWKWLPGFTIVTIASLLFSQFYINRHVFRLSSVQNIGCALLISVVGFIVAALITLMMQQGVQRTCVVSIENGLRSTYITTIVSKASFSSAMRNYANIIPTYTSIFTIWTMLCTVLCVRYIRAKSTFDEAKKRRRTESQCAILTSINVDDSEISDEVMETPTQETKSI